MKSYELIDHTADVGIRAFGRTLEELFKNAAVGMFELMADLETVDPTAEKTLTLIAETLEDLYVLWHQELLFRASVDRMLYKEFLFDTLTERNLKARIRGEGINFEKHHLKKEVKAVTYHELKVQKTKEGWVGEVIFDI
ncbi:MAG: archease [Candidatus Omnitrophica bacterium]|nr:archease [Candidatus Omnitrophota bacterium]